MNSTGCFIWSMCDGSNTEEGILNKITDEFDVATSKAKEDLDKFIGGLEKRILLKRRKSKK